MKAEIIILLLTVCVQYEMVRGNERTKRTLIYIEDTLYGMFLAIAVPVDIPNRNVFVSYNFEANYKVPYNLSDYGEWDPLASSVVTTRASRSITRELTYEILAKRFDEHGMGGRDCLLRNICEAAETPLHENGVMGQIMHVVFTPSTSEDESLDESYYEAELNGLHENCDKYLEKCPLGLFDLISGVA